MISEGQGEHGGAYQGSCLVVLHWKRGSAGTVPEKSPACGLYHHGMNCLVLVSAQFQLSQAQPSMPLGVTVSIWGFSGDLVTFLGEGEKSGNRSSSQNSMLVSCKLIWSLRMISKKPNQHPVVRVRGRGTVREKVALSAFSGTSRETG